MFKEIKHNLLTVKAVREDGLIRIIWEGKSKDRNPETYLAPFFSEILDLAMQTKARIELDFSALHYMNSSTITPVVKMLEKSKEYNLSVTLLYSKEMSWQEISFSAMRFFESDDPPVKIVGV